MSSLSRQQLESWLGTLDIKCDKALDIGGCQLPLHGRTKSWDVKEYLFLDLEHPHIQKTKPDIICDINEDIEFVRLNMIPKEVIDHMDCGFVDMQYCEYFDNVFMFEVLEYVWNPVIAFNNCKELLKKKGRLYFSFHFVYPFHNPQEVDYLRYTPEGINRILEETGFKVVKFQPRTLSEDAFNNYCKMVTTDGMKRCIDSNIIGGMVIAEKL